MKSQDLVRLQLPDTPGVYFWKKGKEILYIGKATSLRDRVRSYFSKDIIDTRGPSILDMTVQATTVEYQQTDSVLEALILEANLIKKYQPKYNVKEKDNKSFCQVIISDELWPRVMIVRSRDLKVMEITGRISRINFNGKIKYTFGPYPNGGSLRDALKIIRGIFPFRDFRADSPENERFYKQLGLSPDTSDSAARAEYLKNITNIKLFFEGKKTKIIKDLERAMHTHAKHLAFEAAEIIKRKIFALNHINDVALIKDDRHDISSKGTRIEAYDIAHHGGTSTVGVMTVITDGQVDKSEYKKFTIKSGKGNDDYGNLREMLTRRFNHPEWQNPYVVVIDGGLGQYGIAQEVVKEMNVATTIVAVIKDERHKPKAIHGDEVIIKKYKRDILLANSEAHRFAITFHKQVRAKKFLQK
ncbi:MAG: GIY-YIG nuclease family protein [bacterium]